MRSIGRVFHLTSRDGQNLYLHDAVVSIDEKGSRGLQSGVSILARFIRSVRPVTREGNYRNTLDLVVTHTTYGRRRTVVNIWLVRARGGAVGWKGVRLALTHGDFSVFPEKVKNHFRRTGKSALQASKHAAWGFRRRWRKPISASDSDPCPKPGLGHPAWRHKSAYPAHPSKTHPSADFHRRVLPIFRRTVSSSRWTLFA